MASEVGVASGGGRVPAQDVDPPRFVAHSQSGRGVGRGAWPRRHGGDGGGATVVGELRDGGGGVAKWGHAHFRPAWPRPPVDVAPPTALLTIGGHGGNWELLVGNGGQTPGPHEAPPPSDRPHPLSEAPPLALAPPPPIGPAHFPKPRPLPRPLLLTRATPPCDRPRPLFKAPPTPRRPRPHPEAPPL